MYMHCLTINYSINTLISIMMQQVLMSIFIISEIANFNEKDITTKVKCHMLIFIWLLL